MKRRDKLTNGRKDRKPQIYSRTIPENKKMSEPVLEADISDAKCSVDVQDLKLELSNLTSCLSGALKSVEKISQMLSAESQPLIETKTPVRNVGTMTELVPCADNVETVSVGLSEPSTSELSPLSPASDVPTMSCQKDTGNSTGRFARKGANCANCRTHDVELFVYGVNRRVETSEMKRYIERRVGVNYVLITSHFNARYRSFVVSVSSLDVPTLMSPGFWPQLVGCRRFVRPISGPLAKGSFGVPLL
jgi:hypothetical protein